MVLKRIILFSVISGSLLLIAERQVNANPDLELLRERVIESFMIPQVYELRVKTLMGSLNEDGTWPGIDYSDVSRTGFQHGQHLTNLVEMSRAFKKQGSKMMGDKVLKKAISSALNLWLEKDFISDNWWWNQIGTPDQMVRILLIMDQDLTKDQVSRAVLITGRANLSASGARPSGDRIKIAGILAKNALFQRDTALFDETVKVIAGEIKFSTGPGMKYDYSFHHRTDRVTSILSYGAGYADAFAEWAALVSETKYSFPEKALKHLIDYYLDGICKSMVYGKYPDPGVKNRGISRRGALKQSGTLTPERLLKASSYRKSEMEKIVKIRNGEVKPDLTSTRFFWESEYFSHQRPGYFTSVRMFSSRNHNVEMPYNSEGLMNHHYADGSNFISRTGKEYYDIYPVFDWQKIPGTTIVQKLSLPSEKEIQKRGLTEFTGAVTDDNCGAAAFDFKSLHDPLTAKKSWFFYENEYVCLGAGITSGSSLPVATTLNQCLLTGDVSLRSDNKKVTLQKGDHKIENVKWVLHDSIGYFFPQPLMVNIANKAAAGSWYKINQQSDSPKEEISKDVFKIWLDHGKQPENDKYQYIVIPLTNLEEMETFGENRDIDILSNTTELQAVRHNRLGVFQAVFYRSGIIEVSPGIVLEADSPGIVMIRYENGSISSVSVSDPSRKLDRMHLTVSVKIEKKGENFTAEWIEQKKASNILIDLPGDVYAGKSVTLKFGN